ncbi:MAG: ethylbenzene dehydrogenase-related protein [Methylobacter sp.]|uniref:ethylbenzene dehydrogenase-related protein n=1 Tax=Methylobacter sp. TaxID=2051955 RepID=UPI0025909BA4|nr:ethylbenzene dehydrogenase-related protein [Methylobacter sp.]MCL7421490.1 ethylbenzene dehydrogenase-related protein [Methylobacter sp.]
MKQKIPFSTLFFSIGLLLWLITLPAWGIDWRSIPGRKITLFYPGQASWEWLLTDHKGASSIKAGQSCTVCHEGMQDEMGQKLVKGKLLEPDPPTGKPGSIELEVKTAHNSDNLYIHLEWTAGAIPANFEAMASVIFDDGRVPEITRGGCWGVCHDDMNGMASAEAGRDIDKYLVKSRTKMTRKGGADNIKPAGELSGLLAAGYFAEIWQARLNPGQPAKVVDGYILETRRDRIPAQVYADAAFANGKWSVDFSRKLTINNPAYKKIEPGKTYTIGFAVHDGYVKGRRHYVSFVNTLRLDEGSADLIARKR